MGHAGALTSGSSAAAKLGRGWADWSTPDFDEKLTCTAGHPEHASVVKRGDNLNSVLFTENKNYPVSRPGDSGEYLLVHASHTGLWSPLFNFLEPGHWKVLPVPD